MRAGVLGDGLEDTTRMKEYTYPARKSGATQDCGGEPLTA